jgi:hypothetical protein
MLFVTVASGPSRSSLAQRVLGRRVEERPKPEKEARKERRLNIEMLLRETARFIKIRATRKIVESNSCGIPYRLPEKGRRKR